MLRTALKRAFKITSPNSDDDQLRFIPDASTIFDVGANIGQTAKRYRRLYPFANIYSLEPHIPTFQELCGALGDRRFHPLPIGLSDRNGSATLNLGKGSLTNSLLVRADAPGETADITLNTLDSVCEQLGIHTIDILKVDVEGAETEVFRGAQRMFDAGAIRAVFVEVYFKPTYDGMALMWDLHRQLLPQGFTLRGLYSLNHDHTGALSFCNALYLHDVVTQRCY